MTMASIRRAAALSILAAGVGTMAVLAQTAPKAPAPAAKTAEPTLIDPTVPDYGKRPVAFIDGDVAITRSELAEFLIARGGYEKVELLVNKRIIERAAAKMNVTVSETEMKAALAKDITGLGIDEEKFVTVVLSKYGKSLFEWMEDVVRPRMLLEKMCKATVTINDTDLKEEFDRQFGDKRKVQIIMWPKGDSLKTITATWDKIRANPEEFDRAAKQQANPALASTEGHVSPISRNLAADDKVVEINAFKLNEGEVSAIFETTQGYMVMKCLKHLPANDKVKFETEKEKLRSAMFEIKLSREIPKYFETLKAAAKPNILMAGPPTEWQYKAAVKQMIEQTGGVPKP